MDIQQLDHHIMTLMFRFIIDCIQNGAQSWTAIFWIEDTSTILHLDLNLPCTTVCFIFVLNNLFLLFWGKLHSWAFTQALLKYIVMLGIW